VRVEARTDRLDEVERRLDSAFDRVMPYAGLAIGLALTPLIVPEGDARFWLVIGGLVAITLVWCASLATVEPVRARRPGLGAVYVGGLQVLMAALTYVSPLFAFLGVAGYAHSFLYLHGRWRFVGLGISALIVSYSQVGGRFTPVTLTTVGAIGVLFIANSLIAGGLTYYSSFIARQNDRRRAVIEELNVVNARLSETLDENAGLHAQLLVQAREAGMLDERARMAREIHDTIAQGLTGIVAQLEAAGVAEGDGEGRRRHIDTARALARESLTEARRSVAALAPGRLADARLPDAIADMAKKWAETAGVDVSVDTTGDPRPLLPEIEVALFRVAQEALANIGKHADATRAGLTLSYMDDVVVLDVRDDGAGFERDTDRAPTGGSGFGLAAMEQRVRRVAGTLTVESAPGEGTALSASVPAIPAEVDT
jgi:signal transduction histidine kinase